MSPVSTVKKRKATQIERSADKAKLAKLADTELSLDDEQSDEFSDVISRIEEAGTDELEEVFKEADSLSVGDSVGAAWVLDKNSAKENFFYGSEEQQ